MATAGVKIAYDTSIGGAQIINCKSSGTGQGGINFYDVVTGGSPTTPIVTIDTSGNIGCGTINTNGSSVTCGSISSTSINTNGNSVSCGSINFPSTYIQMYPLGGSYASGATIAILSGLTTGYWIILGQVDGISANQTAKEFSLTLQSNAGGPNSTNTNSFIWNGNVSSVNAQVTGIFYGAAGSTITLINSSSFTISTQGGIISAVRVA